jgi:hypothetical protein
MYSFIKIQIFYELTNTEEICLSQYLTINIDERRNYVAPSTKRRVYGDNIRYYQDHSHVPDTFSTMYNSGYSKPLFTGSQNGQG